MPRSSKLRAEIERWRSEIPPTVPCAGDTHSLFSTSDWFGMEYNYAILQLYRVQIIDRRAGTPDRDLVFLGCLRASEGICHSYRRQFLGKPAKFTRSALNELFLAGPTYLYSLWTSPAAREAQTRVQVSSTCTDCTIVLVIIAERWKAAAPYRDTFETLTGRTIKMWVTNITDAGMPGDFNGLLASLAGDFSSDVHEF